MLKDKPITQRGHAANRSGQNALEAKKLTLAISQ